MLFGIGTKVKFLHTDDEGIVKKLLGDGIVEVYVEAYDMIIPTHEGDIIRAEDWMETQKTKAKFVPGKQDKSPQAPPRNAPETQYQVIKSLGIQLAFDPILKNDGLTEKYEIFLINDTKQDVIYEIEFQLSNEKEATWNGKLDKLNYCFLGNLFYDELNDAPNFEIKINPITTNGTGSSLRKSLRVKPKNFFKNTRTAPFLNKKVHWYLLFDSFEPTIKKADESLKDYTKKNVRTNKHRPNWDPRVDSVSVQAFAEFNPEIDLHIENLIKNPRKMSNAEILRLQMVHFENFLNKAIQLGVAQIFVIHGVGKGKLRNMIASRLMQHSDVQTFKNEYHHKYGWGATEVIF